VSIGTRRRDLNAIRGRAKRGLCGLAFVAVAIGLPDGIAMADSRLTPETVQSGPIAPQALSKAVEVRVLRQDLAQVLQAVAEQAGFKVTLGKGLARPISDLHLKGEARAALDQLAEKSGAVWWWTGSDIRFVDKSEQITKTLKGRDLNLTFESARTLGIPIDLVAVQRSEVPGLVRVTAPTAIVEDLEALSKDVAEQVNRIQMIRYGRRRVAK
jgi:hypothetical protein